VLASSPGAYARTSTRELMGSPPYRLVTAEVGGNVDPECFRLPNPHCRTAVTAVRSHGLLDRTTGTDRLERSRTWAWTSSIGHNCLL
jgi:hypothetical protein